MAIAATRCRLPRFTSFASIAFRAWEILVKRDDLFQGTGGGNKARKISFIGGEAEEKGSDAVVTNGARSPITPGLPRFGPHPKAGRAGLYCMVIPRI